MYIDVEKQIVILQWRRKQIKNTHLQRKDNSYFSFASPTTYMETVLLQCDRVMSMMKHTDD